MSDLKLFEQWCRMCGHYREIEALARFRTFQISEEYIAWLGQQEEADDPNNHHAG